MQNRQTITREQLRTLSGRTGERLVSICMPTVRRGQETRQNPIRFRNLLDDVEQQLKEAGEGATKVQQRLEPLRNLLDDGDFWRHLGDGLAIYQDSDETVSYRAPFAIEERAIVGGRFHLKPLLSNTAVDRPFYIVVVSQGELHVLECRHDDFVEVEFRGLPEGMESISQYLDVEKHVQFHTAETGGGGTGGGEIADHRAAYHGQGAIKDDEKVRIREYFKVLDGALDKLVKDKRAPVNFAGVDYLYPMFRDAVDSVHLLDEHVAGNFDEVRSNFKELHAKGRDIMSRLLEEERAKALDRYGHAVSNGKATTDLKEVLAAAHDGKVAAFEAVEQARHVGRAVEDGVGEGG